MIMNNLNVLPDNLPAPIDDGACKHLPGLKLPDITLPATSGDHINLSALNGTVVLYFYPMTGRPDVALPDGWDEIPGARGCTPQACAFRDHHADLKSLGSDVFGISTQDNQYQKEAKERLHLPFDLISDKDLELKEALSLPTFIVEKHELFKRFTLIVKDFVIVKVFYPVFPPNENPDNVISWLQTN
jgi:peroxiredoxin